MAAPEVQQLEVEVARLRDVLTSLIAWMAQSANSPINRQEAEELLTRLARK